jgi:hypothetical protein
VISETLVTTSPATQVTVFLRYLPGGTLERVTVADGPTRTRTAPRLIRVCRTSRARSTRFMKRAAEGAAIAEPSLHGHRELALHMTVLEELMCVAYRGHR